MATVRNNIPLDLTIEILLRLPAKSLFRFRCVSKTWCSIIRSRKFADAFMSLSLSRPRFLLAFSHGDDDRLLFFSTPDESCSFSSSSSSSSSLSTVAAKKSTLTISKVRSIDIIIRSNSVRGFLCCSIHRRLLVCNPATRQMITLPEDRYPNYSREFYLYMGYDPSNDQYKVLRLESSDMAIGHSVCTLGGQQSWRSIKSSILYYNCNYNGVCIDGVVYYQVCLEPRSNSMEVIGSFDVASEQLGLIKTPENMVARLTNYLGKLAAYDFSNDDFFILWVLDDVKNQVWSKKTCVFSSFTHSLFWKVGLHIAGVTAAGEMVYFPLSFSNPYELLFYHVEKKVERRIKVEGLVDHIYDGVRSCASTYLWFASVSCLHVDNIIYL